MVKPAGPDVYSATYSNIPVYEYQFGEGLKEHVMRRRSDNWINATHILKAAGFDKPARTRILEREVQKDRHEKVQGGYGKYQGTWVPLEQGEVLAHKNNVYDKLRMIFEYHPGEVSPPPAPKHTTAKPKLPKKPAVPKFAPRPVAAPSRMITNNDDYDDTSQMDNESIADDTTVASAYGPEDDRYDMSQQSTGHRKRKRLLEEQQQSNTERDHVLYADDLLDYFMLSTSGSQGTKPEPPINFQPDWIIDTDAHTALHWAAAMGDVEVMKELRRFNANPTAQNVRGETPLMRCVLFTNCLDKQTMPSVVKDLIDTIDCVDFCQATVLHHAAALTISRQKHQCARYYLDIILNKMQEVLEPSTLQRILDARDVNGNTAVHIAAKNKARKCVRALIGRGANTNIPNQENITAEELIQDLNESRKLDRHQQGSSSPYGPDSRSLYGDMPEEPNRNAVHHISEAAMSIESHITPMIIEKFQDLANSFDDELVDKETSEKEARRILKSTIQELESMRAQILETSIQKEGAKALVESKEQLAHFEKAVTALIESQQKLQLWSRSQHEESKSNGHMSGEDDLGERIMLAKMLGEESKRRRLLVGDYRNATSMAGAGENGERYQQLLRKCLGKDSENMEENIDVLVEQLVEDLHGQKGETVLPDSA